MTPSKQRAGESPKCFAAWLMAFFLAVLGSKLLVIQLYGSPLPLWDQWYEARSFFKPWMDGHLTASDFFASDNGHRIFVTRLLDFIVVGLNGRWEPMVQMAGNVLLESFYACGLAWCLWQVMGRKNGWLICCLLAPFFMLPYAGENNIWAITLEYNLDVFMLLTVALLGFARPGGWWWWLGLLAAVTGLFTMATGLLAPMTVGAIAFLRLLKQRRLEKWNLITLVVCVAVVGLGMATRGVAVGGNQLQAHSAGQFAVAAFHEFTWLFYDHPMLALVIWVPPGLLFVQYFRRDFQPVRGAEFLLGLGLWGGLQALALGYGRANYGDVFPVSRYLDIINVYIIASLFAVLLLVDGQPVKFIPKKIGLLVPVVFAAVICFGLGRISNIVIDQLLLPTRMSNLVAEERVQTYETTGDEKVLFEPPTVRPDPGVALEVLRDPGLHKILPACCLPPATSPVTGRLSLVSECLLRNSIWILSAGLIGFIGLLGYQLCRSPLGLAWENLPGLLVFIALLGALTFVGLQSPIRRETVERRLDNQLVLNFKLQGKSQRAAYFAQQAKQLEGQ